MNKYRELKNRHQKDIDAFSFFFAFSDKQFNEGMKSLGLQPTDTDKIYKLGNTGGFYRKSDSQLLRDMLARHAKEMDEAISTDKTGYGFIYDMFKYELANHEYCITYDYEATFDACGLTIEEINNNPALIAGLKKAEKDYLEECF